MVQVYDGVNQPDWVLDNIDRLWNRHASARTSAHISVEAPWQFEMPQGAAGSFKCVLAKLNAQNSATTTDEMDTRIAIVLKSVNEDTNESGYAAPGLVIDRQPTIPPESLAASSHG